FARALLDGARDGVVRHVRLARGEDGGAQAGVVVGVAASGPGGDGHLADQLGEERPLAGAHRLLLAPDLGPSIVARHGCSAIPVPSASSTRRARAPTFRVAGPASPRRV